LAKPKTAAKASINLDTQLVKNKPATGWKAPATARTTASAKLTPATKGEAKKTTPPSKAPQTARKEETKKSPSVT